MCFNCKLQYLCSIYVQFRLSITTNRLVLLYSSYNCFRASTGIVRRESELTHCLYCLIRDFALISWNYASRYYRCFHCAHTPSLFNSSLTVLISNFPIHIQIANRGSVILTHGICAFREKKQLPEDTHVYLLDNHYFQHHFFQELYSTIANVRRDFTLNGSMFYRSSIVAITYAQGACGKRKIAEWKGTLRFTNWCAWEYNLLFQ